jgi:NitT/TauT family transport system ATP-binding protein
MIELKNVYLRFEEKTIFNGYNYTFENNKIYTIMGKSGCGKTTLLRIIAGLLPPTKGEVIYNNEKVKKQNKNIFMMHQAHVNFPWKTCLDNVLFPIKLQQKVTPEHVQQAITMLEKVDLKGCEKLYPHELSGGMNQRLALARVLVTKPKVILMDEPLSALDFNLRTGMQDLILQLHKETQNTIILVTHDADEGQRLADVQIKF